MQLFRRWHREITLRVTAPDAAEPRTFEALVLAGRRRKAAERIRAETPYLRALPDTDVTIVVTAIEAGTPIEVACEVTRRGRPVLAGRSWWPIAVLERRRGRIIAAGLDGPFGDDGAGTPAALRAV